MYYNYSGTRDLIAYHDTLVQLPDAMSQKLFFPPRICVIDLNRSMIGVGTTDFNHTLKLNLLVD